MSSDIFDLIERYPVDPDAKTPTEIMEYAGRGREWFSHWLKEKLANGEVEEVRKLVGKRMCIAYRRKA